MPSRWSPRRRVDVRCGRQWDDVVVVHLDHRLPRPPGFCRLRRDEPDERSRVPAAVAAFDAVVVLRVGYVVAVAPTALLDALAELLGRRLVEGEVRIAPRHVRSLVTRTITLPALAGSGGVLLVDVLRLRRAVVYRLATAAGAQPLGGSEPPSLSPLSPLRSDERRAALRFEPCVRALVARRGARPCRRAMRARASSRRSVEPLERFRPAVDVAVVVLEASGWRADAPNLSTH